jgi:hypothetical protein
MAEITYDKIKNMKALKNIPVLTLDQRWYQLVPEVSKTDEIKYWEKKVNALLKRQGQINDDLTDIKKIKAQLIQSVVESMEDEDDAKHQKKMNQSQRLIREAKDKISTLEEEENSLPAQLAEANRKLLVETAKMCYSRINENKDDLETLDKWIEATRIKLKKNLLIKQDKENINNALYTGMHSIFGAEIMGELDRINDGKK